MARSKQQQLDDLDALIAKVEAAGENESVTVLGRQFTKRSLDELYRERARLEPLATREQAGGKRSVRRVFPL
jgi:hypothetical protein